MSRQEHEVIEVPQTFCTNFLDPFQSTVALVLGGRNEEPQPGEPPHLNSVELFGCPEGSPGAELSIANYPGR